MGKGLSRQQRAILDVLPLDGEGGPAGAFGITVEEVAERLGRLSPLSTEARQLRMQLGKPDRRHILTAAARYSIYRALLSLQLRGLAILRPGAREPGRTGRWLRVCP